MQMVAHNGVTAHINSEESGEVAKPIDNPRLTVRVITTGVGVGAAKEGSADAPSNAVIHTDALLVDDVAACRGRHVRLHHQAGAARTRVVFTRTVMDKNTNNGAGVKTVEKKLDSEGGSLGASRS